MASEEIPETNGTPKTPIQASFLQFLYGMAAQTSIHLGTMPNPYTNDSKADLVQARYSIDLLGVLEEKTRGNRTPEEDEYFRVILTNLRLAFVEATKEAARAFQAEMERTPAQDSPSPDPDKA